MKWHTGKWTNDQKKKNNIFVQLKQNIHKTQDIKKKLNNQSKGMNIVLFHKDSLRIILFSKKTNGMIMTDSNIMIHKQETEGCWHSLLFSKRDLKKSINAIENVWRKLVELWHVCVHLCVCTHRLCAPVCMHTSFVCTCVYAHIVSVTKWLDVLCPVNQYIWAKHLFTWKVQKTRKDGGKVH